MGTASNQKLVFFSSGSLSFVNSDDIVYCRSEGNYTTLHLRHNNRMVICRQLGNLDKTLPPASFLRVHYSYIVNLEFVVRYLPKENLLLLSTGETIPVAKRRKKEMMSRFTSL